MKVHKTDVPVEPQDTRDNLFTNKPEEPDRQCPIHKKPHPLKKCKLFREKPLEERRVYLRENRICFRCCGSVQHMARDCKIDVKCFECGSDKHISALHPGPPPSRLQKHAADKDDGEEQSGDSSPSVISKCTEVCGNVEGSRSCAKILLVKVYPTGEREKAVKMYAVLGEQSNKSLAKSEFFDLFNIQTNPTPYTLRKCSGKIDTSGRRGTNFTLESVNGRLHLPLPPLIECDMVPHDRAEIPSPGIALHHPHLKPVADKIQPVDDNAPILLLIGRDMVRVHKVREQINGPHDALYAQRLDWVIVGEVCLGQTHKSSEINVYKTNMLHSGRSSFLPPCPNTMFVKDNYACMSQCNSLTVREESAKPSRLRDNLGHSIFERSKEDDKPALSIDDKTFLAIMDAEVKQDEGKSWVAPLPFRFPRRHLPNNREQALKRLQSLRKMLEKKTKMKHVT